jgi:hypothetical protein
MRRLDAPQPSMTDEEFMAILKNTAENDEEETEEKRMAVEQARIEIREGKATPIDDLLMKHGL